jgi:anti-sigma regulatory factor (Ser/Thr protein kinase)
MQISRPVTLTAPAERSSVRLVRILAAGVAANAGLSIDDTEDLRIAVSELVALLVDGTDAGSTIEVELGHAAGEVVVEGRRPAVAGDAEAAEVDDLVLGILQVVVDDHTFDSGDGGRRFRIVKRARAAS